MKKLIILILFIACCFVCHPQSFKIGNITIDSETFKEYISDCYLHPDTIQDKDPFEGMCSDCLVDSKVLDEREKEAKEFNDNLRKNNIGLLVDTIY